MNRVALALTLAAGALLSPPARAGNVDGGGCTQDLTFPHLDAMRISEPISIDGRLAEPAWQRAPRAALIEGSNTTNTAGVRVLWDETYLYLGYDVLDDAQVFRPDGGLWEQDGVEFFLDPLLDRALGLTLKHDDFQLLVSIEPRHRVNQGNVAGTGFDDVTSSMDVPRAVDVRADGYTLEARLTWAELTGSAPAVNQVMGAHFLNDDLEVLGGQVTWRKFWDFGNNHQVSCWGFLTFVEAPDASLPDASAPPDASTPRDAGTQEASNSGSLEPPLHKDLYACDGCGGSSGAIAALLFGAVGIAFGGRRRSSGNA